jgi:NTP pyrophosphatase (non-canonical NTP hydrolase)
MNADEYQNKAIRTECDQQEAYERYVYPERENFSSLVAVRLNHSVIGLMGEVGELAGELENWLHYGKPLRVDKWKEEIGDCLWYLSQMCTVLNLKLGDVAAANLAKLYARYPNKYSGQQADRENRDTEREQRALGKQLHGEEDAEG